MQKMKGWRKEKLLKAVDDIINEAIYRFECQEAMKKDINFTGNEIRTQIKDLFKEL